LGKDLEKPGFELLAVGTVVDPATGRRNPLPKDCQARRGVGLEDIVSKRKDSAYRCGRSRDWLKMRNPACAAVTREAEEDWAKGR
jgi:hypothetical protein